MQNGTVQNSAGRVIDVWTASSTLIVKEDATIIVSQRYASGIAVELGLDVKLYGGTFSSDVGKALYPRGKLSDMLPGFGDSTAQEHYAYYDANGNLITTGLENRYFEKMTVTVKECTHAGQLTNNGDGTHSGTCPACGTTFTDADHNWVETTSGASCTACGAEAAVKIEKTDGTTAYGGASASELTAMFSPLSDNSGAVLTLLKELELTNQIQISIPCTLDLNGHTIHASGPFSCLNAMQVSNVTIRGEGGVTNESAMALLINNRGSVTLEGGDFYSARGSAVSVTDGTLYVTGDQVKLRGGTYGLNVGSNYSSYSPTVKLSAGAYSGTTGAIAFGSQCSLTLADLLTEGNAYHSGDTPIVLQPDGKELTGTVTVKACNHTGEGVCTYTHNENASTHTKTCLVCGQTWDAEDCTYTFSDATGTCAACKDSVTVAVSDTDGLIYDGTEKKPGVTVMRGETALAAGTDYTVAYSNNKNAGENKAAVTVTIGNGQGTYTENFSIGKATPTIEWNPQDVTLTHTGQPAEVKPVVTLVNGETFSGTITYTYGAYSGPDLPTDVGAYSIKASITEQDNYTAAGTGVDLSLTITKADQTAPAAPTAEDANIKDTSITLTVIENAEYSKDGTNWQESPEFTGLEQNRAYTFYARLKEDDNHNASPSSAGTSITTRKTMLDSAVVTVSGSYAYTGAAIVPEAGNVEVVLNGTKIASDQYTISASNNINAGVDTATLTVTATENGDYSGSVSAAFTIGKASLTIKASDQTITYGGGIAQGPGQVTPTGLCSGDTLESVTLEASTSDVPGGNITPSGAVIKRGGEDVTENYNITYQPGALTINKSQPTIAWANGFSLDKSYDGQTIPNPTANNLTITDANFSDVTFEWSATPKDAGTYTLTAKIAETNNTEAANTSPLTVTISKATLTATGATAASKTYDTNDTAAVTGVTFSGLVSGETLALGTDYTASGEFDSENAGTGKSVTVTVILADTAKANNYNLTPNTTTATADITKADPVVTDVSVSSPDPIYESVSLNNITLTHGADDTAGTVALDAGQTLTVGTKGYAWTFTPTDTDNYNTATGTISLTVAVDALQSIAVTTPPSKTAYTYGESFDKAGMVITATYASGATKVVTGEVQISPAELTVTTTALTITYQGKTVTQAITVSPKEVTNPTIELSPTTFVYDGAEKKPAVTVKDGEKVIPADEYTVEYSNNTNVGTTATVTITDNPGGNYTVSGSTTFTITAKPLTGARVEVTGTFTYTGNALTPAPTVTLDGKTLTENTDYTVAYDKNTDAGTATITVTGKGNYSGTAQGTFTIGRATLTADGTGTASGTYGDKLSELTVSGLTAKLGEATVTGTWKLAGGTVPNVGDSGEYTATFTPATGADNYNALEAKVTLTIAQATAPTPQTGTLNVQNGHAREYTYDLSRLLSVLASGQSFGGDVTYTLKSVNITEAGYYDSGTAAISGATLTLPIKAVTSSIEGQIGTITVTISSKNFADVEATINVNRVNKQPVSIEGVTAQNGTYNGKSHSGYTGTPTASPYSGGFTVTYAKVDGTALSGPPTNAGDYTVTITLNENNDYTGSRTLSFTISKASITIKADDKRADVGAAKPALTYTVTGLVSGDTLATAPTLACDADMNTIGQYPITASGAAVPSGGNYNTAITYVPGTLSVTDPTIPVTGVTLNKTSAILTVGGSERLTATVTPSDATDKSVTWASSNTSVATVDASGNITAVSAGTATITVTTADGAKTATCSVTVRSNSGGGSSYVPSTPSNPSTSAITVPVSGDKSTVNVSASVSGTTATVSRIDTTQIENVIGDNGQASMVEIDFTGLGKTIDTVKLPAAAIKDIAAKAQNEEVGGLTVKLPEAEISFDANALSAIQAQASSQITLTVTPAKPTDLNNRQKEAVGSAPVFDLTLRSSSGAITDFRGGYATVSLPYTLAAGQNPSGVVVYYLDSTGNITPCTTMYDVRSKSAIFTTGHLSLYFVGYDPTAVWVNPFSDVAEGAWYYDAVRYASENGLMGGYGNGMFGPNDNLSRAQFAQILFNKEGRPVVNYLLQYSDVADGAWYTEAIRWATSLGIVGGYGNGTFGPNDNITREQLAVMLWRYSGSPAATNKELHFNDTDEISGFALEALRWAVENGIINGYGNGRLGPQGRATRAQVAQILKNFLDNQK